MKVRTRIFELNWYNPKRRLHVIKRMLFRNEALLRAAGRKGIVLKGWITRGRPRYQVIHMDITNPAHMFYAAVGAPMPAKFAVKRVTVGGLDRLVGYLKLHTTPSEREHEQEKIDASDAEDEAEFEAARRAKWLSIM